MNKIQKLVSLLQQKGFEPKTILHKRRTPYNSSHHNYVPLTEINWEGKYGEEYCVYDTEIEENEDSFAWFQSSDQNDFSLHIVSPKENFDWIPKTYNSVGHCMCHLLEWIAGELVFVYQDNQGIYICAIRDRQVRYINFHGNYVERNENIFAYQSYADQTNEVVHLIEIPSLKSLSSLPLHQAELLDLYPICVKNNYLK